MNNGGQPATAATASTATGKLFSNLSVNRRFGYILMCIMVSFLTVIPLFVLLVTSLKPTGLMNEGDVSLNHYLTVFGSAGTYQLLGNTFLFASGALALGMSIAMVMAWLVERTDVPYKQWIYVAIFLPMAIPGMITALGWTFLLNPTNGLINVYIRSLFGLDVSTGPFNIYSVGGMIFIAGISYAPTMFIMLSSVVKNLDPSLEEAAVASGADKWGVMGLVVMPLLRPGLLSVFIFFMVIMVETVEIPLLLGLNAGFQVLSVMVYTKTSGGDSELPNYALASTYAVVGLLIGLLLLLLYFYLTKQANRYAVITGKGYKPKIYKLGKFKFLAIAFIGVFFLLKLVLPVLLLLWTSMIPYFQHPSLHMLSLVSFKNFTALFKLGSFVQAVWNTIYLTIGASLACMLLAALLSWMIVRGKGKLAKLLDVIAFLPHLIPGIVIGLALLLVSVGTPLYGTISVLIIGYVIRYLPFGIRTMTSVLMQISAELEDAAYTSGASTGATFRRVVLPLVMPAFINGILWVGSHAMRDLTLPLFLISSSNVVMGSLIYSTWTQGHTTATSAISVLLVAVLLLIITPVQLWLNRKVDRIVKKSKGAAQ